MSKVYSVAIIGCGSRGFGYARHMVKMVNKYKVVSACDIDDVALRNTKKLCNIEECNIFRDEVVFFEKKRADVLVIATQDRDHVRMTIRALELGYDILLEKPISPDINEMKALLEANKRYNRKIVVCHVLRYAPAYVKMKQIIDSGAIGRIINIESIEPVNYWHQSHSFVRGNWRREDETSPMIMQKCCHDMDILQYLADSRCDTIYSIGKTAFFNKENQPEGAADRCKDCKYKDTCPYGAEHIYIERWKAMGAPAYEWPFYVMCNDDELTEDGIRRAYENNQYGRCVFACDNTVVDNQQVLMTFENGIIASHTMTAFSAKSGRGILVHGTYGEIELAEFNKTLSISIYGKESQVYSIPDLIKEADAMGHGGGDSRMIESLYDVLENDKEAQTTIEKSVESHLMALAAEKSRIEGKIVKVHE